MQKSIVTDPQSHTKFSWAAEESLSVLAELLLSMLWMLESLPVTSGQKQLTLTLITRHQLRTVYLKEDK